MENIVQGIPENQKLSNRKFVSTFLLLSLSSKTSFSSQMTSLPVYPSLQCNDDIFLSTYFLISSSLMTSLPVCPSLQWRHFSIYIFLDVIITNDVTSSLSLPSNDDIFQSTYFLISSSPMTSLPACPSPPLQWRHFLATILLLKLWTTSPPSVLPPSRLSSTIRMSSSTDLDLSSLLGEKKNDLKKLANPFHFSFHSKRFFPRFFPFFFFLYKFLRPEHDCYAKFASCST